jgi:hypothetical protein
MPALVLVSAKGSPGATTAAGALAAVATTTGRALLAELDPSGGSVQVLTGSAATVGLMDAAGQLRREPSPAVIEENLALIPAGLPTLLAPTAGAVTESVIESVSSRWVPTLRPCAEHVVVDAGRWEPSQRTALRVVGGDLMVVVCRATVAGVEHSRHLLDRLREVARRPVAVVVVGDRPYPPEQVAGYLDVPLGGTLAWDPRGVAGLWNHGVTRVWLRSALARSARDTLANLIELVPGTTVSSSPAAALDTALSSGSGQRPAVPAPRRAPEQAQLQQAPSQPAQPQRQAPPRPSQPQPQPRPQAPPPQPAPPQPQPQRQPQPQAPAPQHQPQPPARPQAPPAAPPGPPPAPAPAPPPARPSHLPPPPVGPPPGHHGPPPGAPQQPHAPAPAPVPAPVPGPQPHPNGGYPPPPPPPPGHHPPRASHPEVAP